MDELVKKLLELLEDEFTTTFRKYHYGDSHIYNRTLLPAIYVIPISVDISNSGTVHDKMDHAITIRVILDMKNYLKEGGEIQSATQQLVKWVEETSDKEPIDKTIIGVVRKNIDLDEYTLYNDSISVSYDDEYIEVGENGLLKKVDISLTYSRRSLRNT